MTVLPAWPRPPHPLSAPEPHVSHASGRRLTWAGPAARAIWRPRLARLAAAAVAIDLALVRDGAIHATLLTVGHDALPEALAAAARHRLAAVPLGGRAAIWEPTSPTAEPDAGALCDLLVARPDHLPAVVDLLSGGDAAATAAAFGHPPCCATARAGRLAEGWTDPVAALLAGLSGSASGRRVPALPSAHLLLAALGVGPLRHAPCTPDCPATLDAVESFLAAGRRAGFGEEMAWLVEAADWRVRWSTRGGVAEIKTALFRTAHPSDPVPAMRLDHPGGTVPEAAARGTGFPFEPPRPAPGGRPAATAEPAPAAAPAPPPLSADAIAAGWQAAGYADAFALRSRLCTAIWELGAELKGGRGSVVHLGCGDGLLLALAAEVNARLTLYGIDADPGLMARARSRLPAHADRLPVGDWRGTEGLDLIDLATGDGRMAVVDPEGLAGLAAEQRAALLEALMARFRHVAIVASDRALGRHGDVAGIAAAAGLHLAPGRPERVTGRVVGVAAAVADLGQEERRTA